MNLASERNSDPIMGQEMRSLQSSCSWETEIECQCQNDDLNRQLESLWKTDFDGSLLDSKVCDSMEDRKALKIMGSTLTMIDGRYQVALPWRYNPPYLPNNKIVALRRAFFLKKRLMKNENLHIKHQETMNSYIDDGHAEKIPKEELEPDDRPVWYVPHHPVVHPLQLEKVRVVCDCAATYKGTSLNQQLMSGPDQTSQLVGVLIRFRQEKVGLVADIEAMFHQVLVEPKDRDVLRFLWWPNADLSKELEEYRMVKHLFGATSSPSVTNFCLWKTAELNCKEFDDVTTDTVKRNMYVDDLLKSTETTEKAIRLVRQLRELLQRGGFRLTKWFSNDEKVLASVPKSERAKSVVNLKGDRLPTENTLGLRWNSGEDVFVWTVTEKMLQSTRETSITRRGMVSAVYSFFDPLGFIAPFVMKAKLLLQILSRKQVGWDDPLPDDEQAQWSRWLEDIPKLQEVKISRCFKPLNFDEIKAVQLHLFSDASRVGYAAVAYLRLVDTGGNVHIAFVMGKSRLAPLREISIPYNRHDHSLLLYNRWSYGSRISSFFSATGIWIIKGRSAVRRVIKYCIDCQRRKAKLLDQYMASLPKDRITPDKPAFTYVGTDYFGPLQVKVKRSRCKRYGCIFTCLTTRAVHIEITHSLDTDSMINALRKFICIRGCPELLRSDRGTNFVCGNKEQNQAMEDWNQHKINEFCIQRKIEWIFNAPSASHMNGVTERMIRSVRQILKAILKEQIVTDEVILTVMAEVMNILNSRPLTRNSDSPLDDEPITPNHLLHLRPTTALPPGLFNKEYLNSKRAWRQAQYLAGLFWRRCTKEYLPTLFERKKWTVPRRNMKVGDLVLLADETFPRGQWPLGLITEVLTSRDGYVRTVRVKTSSSVATKAKRQRKGEYKVSSTILTRPVHKLCFLELDSDEYN